MGLIKFFYADKLLLLLSLCVCWTSAATEESGNSTRTSHRSSAASTAQEDIIPSPRQLNLSPGFNNLRFANDPSFGQNSQFGFQGAGFGGQNGFSPISVPYSRPDCLGHPPGMYGSPTYGCQVFFICQSDGRLDPMPCPQGTRFNNYLGVCDWPSKVDANCNPIYSENYERYGALATLYGSDPLNSQYLQFSQFQQPGYGARNVPQQQFPRYSGGAQSFRSSFGK
ncbi:hypothetical protein RvY_01435 [Ramazzottius varieornatus]|uniref:Chitin-binding type-2 domain-containing protein n=1 Tax=Ramazzottius varieornatus TaxID=947166 RepID=A0A1D1UH73_RAMVA|nr:hypothetical protein RvY_01435 [Ramazzottius varieornatus]